MDRLSEQVKVRWQVRSLAGTSISNPFVTSILLHQTHMLSYLIALLVGFVSANFAG